MPESEKKADPKPQPQPDPDNVFIITWRDSYTGDTQTVAYTFAPAAQQQGNGTDTFDEFMREKVEAVKSAPKDGVVEIDLRETGWTTLKRDIFEAAVARGDVTIVIYYSQWGRDYTLTIPAATALTPEMAEAQFLEVSQLGSLTGLPVREV